MSEPEWPPENEDDENHDLGQRAFGFVGGVVAAVSVLIALRVEEGWYTLILLALAVAAAWRVFRRQ